MGCASIQVTTRISDVFRRGSEMTLVLRRIIQNVPALQEFYRAPARKPQDPHRSDRRDGQSQSVTPASPAPVASLLLLISTGPQPQCFAHAVRTHTQCTPNFFRKIPYSQHRHKPPHYTPLTCRHCIHFMIVQSKTQFLSGQIRSSNFGKEKCDAGNNTSINRSWITYLIHLYAQETAACAAGDDPAITWIWPHPSRPHPVPLEEHRAFSGQQSAERWPRRCTALHPFVAPRSHTP